MSESSERVFGVPSVPRNTMPSMFQILAWGGNASQVQVYSQSHKKREQSLQTKNKWDQQLAKEKEHHKDNDNTGNGQNQKKKSPLKPHQIKYELYLYSKNQLKKTVSQPHYETVEPKVLVPRRLESAKKLDPHKQKQKQQIEVRKQRIKKFQLVTRDLPNSAFITYYGKPAFEAYGRGSSNSNLRTHNIMPHKGQNCPKQVQTYYNALIKGRKVACSNYIPRKPLQERQAVRVEEPQEIINLHMEAPDLINNVRFAADEPKDKDNLKIPSHIVAPRAFSVKERKIKKKKQSKRQKINNKNKSKTTTNIQDGLKYMNSRENLLQILQHKKTNSTKLAYKVTQCYPCEWQNEQKLRQSILSWKNTQPAGKPPKLMDKVADLLQFWKESPF